MKRIFEPRNKIPERWRCERAGCHRIIPISDVDLLSEIQDLFNSIISKYYVENNHPAIIDDITFGKVQEEIARRNSKRKVKQIGTKTELGKYSSKYALTELLVCGECGSPYRRCTWTASGCKRIVWRCINRLDYGKKYCHDSPTIEEGVLHKAITEAIKTMAMQNSYLLQTLRTHIAMHMERDDKEDKSSRTSKYTTKSECVKFHGISQRKECIDDV